VNSKPLLVWKTSPANPRMRFQISLNVGFVMFVIKGTFELPRMIVTPGFSRAGLVHQITK
jgi:hypothetical protein